MKIPFPHSDFPVTRLAITGPGVDIVADADRSIEFHELELPEGVQEHELRIIAQYVKGSQVVGAFTLQEPVELPRVDEEPKIDEEPVVDDIDELDDELDQEDAE